MFALALQKHFTPDGVRTAAARVTINIALLTEGRRLGPPDIIKSR